MSAHIDPAIKAAGLSAIPIEITFVCIFLSIAAIGYALSRLNKHYFLWQDAKTCYQQVMIIAKSRYFAAMKYTTADIFEHFAKIYANRPFLTAGKITWTYRDCDFLANRLARWLKSMNIGKDDVMALVMENCPEYIIFWLAMHKVGGACALVNYNLTGEPLLHSLSTSGCRLVVCDTKNVASIIEAYEGKLPFPVFLFDSLFTIDESERLENGESVHSILRSEKSISPLKNGKDGKEGMDLENEKNDENSIGMTHTVVGSVGNTPFGSPRDSKEHEKERERGKDLEGTERYGENDNQHENQHENYSDTSIIRIRKSTTKTVRKSSPNGTRSTRSLVSASLGAFPTCERDEFGAVSVSVSVSVPQTEHRNQGLRRSPRFLSTILPEPKQQQTQARIQSQSQSQPRSPHPGFVLNNFEHEMEEKQSNYTENQSQSHSQSQFQSNWANLNPIEKKEHFLKNTKNLFDLQGILGNDVDNQFSGESTPKEWRKGCSFFDIGLLIYTSGTTGLPKAAKLPHSRIYGAGYLFSHRFGAIDGDVIYNVLPLYHSSGGVMAVSLAMCCGGSLVIRKKFSARSFWKECGETNATVVLYIGELCRYLLQTPPSAFDRKHQVRLAIGNGLRPEIWKEFQDRFQVPHVGEFYASTEGNAGLFNFCRDTESQGAIGHMGAFVEYMSNMRLIKVDDDNEPIRDPKTGRCILVEPGDPGELIAKIIEWDPIRNFSGYHGNKEGTKKKIVEDAFKKGDKYFRTGDLLRRDDNGLWYFVDRIGDTFRWKGENVSTAEVGQVLSKCPGDIFSDCNVYGAQIPSHDGRACVAAVTVKNGANTLSQTQLHTIAKYCEKNLPSYAIPIFLRVLSQQMATTTTFKHMKNELRNDGVDPRKVTQDVIYVLLGKEYVQLTPKIWDEITSLKAKL